MAALVGAVLADRDVVDVGSHQACVLPTGPQVDIETHVLPGPFGTQVPAVSHSLLQVEGGSELLEVWVVAQLRELLEAGVGDDFFDDLEFAGGQVSEIVRIRGDQCPELGPVLSMRAAALMAATFLLSSMTCFLPARF
jgi:hypothetical protein